MQIEKMTTVLRPRNNWEAIDLGFYMGHFWFLRLWLLWMLTALPVFIICQLFLYKHPDLAGLVIWWLKPVYELPLLFFLSRAMFGEYLQIKDIRKNYFRIIKSLALPLLTWRRFSLSRSFNNPVQMLEELRGKDRRDRLKVLNYNTNSVGQWLTVVCVHFELFLYFSVIGLLLMLIPDEVQWFDWRAFFSSESVYFQLVGNFIYFIIMSLIAPFYTAAGFSLYLGRRTDLEGWDIELGFKKLINRLHANMNLKPAIMILLVVCCSLGHSQPAYSQTTDSVRAASVIKEVVNRSEFGELKTRHTWKKRKLSKVERDGWHLPGFIQDFLDAVGRFFSAIGNLFNNSAGWFEAMLWIAVIALLIMLLLRLQIWTQWLGGSAVKKGNKKTPTRLFGLDLKAEALPADILAQVQQYIASGELRAALSLLYRASLINLIHLHQLDIPESATEGECLRIVNKNRPEDESSFFHRMTLAWLRLAYAHEIPDSVDLKKLSREWQLFYGINK